MYDDRLYQVDLRGSRSFGSGARRVKLMVDLYNALNGNAGAAARGVRRRRSVVVPDRRDV